MQPVAPRLEWSASAFFGAAAVALGILALIGIVPMTLSAVAIIVLGLAALIPQAALGEAPPVGVWGFRALVGVAAVALGVLALIGIVPLTLTAVGVIVLGVDDFVPAGRPAAAAGRVEWGFRTFVGAAAVALGILALIGVIPETLVAIAIIVLGIGDIVP